MKTALISGRDTMASAADDFGLPLAKRWSGDVDAALKRVGGARLQFWAKPKKRLALKNGQRLRHKEQAYPIEKEQKYKNKKKHAKLDN